MKLNSSYPINHLIEIQDIDDYFNQHLGFDDINNISEDDWLQFNDQILLELTSGEVYHDGLNRLNKYRDILKFYPQNIIKIRLASLWLSIWNEEPFLGIENDDFIGLKLISTRIISTLIKILFYLEDRYIPYSKWFSYIFSSIPKFKYINQIITGILTENIPKLILDKICILYNEIMIQHNNCDYLPKLDNKVRDFFNSPYKVVFAETIVEKLMDSLEFSENTAINLNKIGLDIKLESIDFTE